MAGETTGVAVGLSIKTGVLAAFGAFLVSAIAVAIGLTVVPPDPHNPVRDIGRRLVCGLLSSFTLGPFLAIKVFEWWPAYLATWQTALPGINPLWALLAAASPFIAITALPGFWIVTAFMRWFTRRAGKDIEELVDDAKKGIRENP